MILKALDQSYKLTRIIYLGFHAIIRAMGEKQYGSLAADVQPCACDRSRRPYAIGASGVLLSGFTHYLPILISDPVPC